MLSWKDRRSVASAQSQHLPNECSKRKCASNTFSASSKRAAIIEHTVAAIGYTPGTDDKESLEHLSVRQEAAANKSDLKVEVLDKTKYKNLENRLALSMIFQKPLYRVLVSICINAGMPRFVASLLDTGASPNLIYSE